MKHISKLTGKVYVISYSSEYEVGTHDDITLIWDFNAGSTGEVRLIGWYFGGYSYDATEKCVEQSIYRLEFPCAYADLIEDCLKTIRQYNLFWLMGGCDGDKSKIPHLQRYVDDVLHELITPLADLSEDVQIRRK